MEQVRVGFIGGGNMAHALIGGLLTGGVAAEKIYVSEPDDTRRAVLLSEYGITAVLTNGELLDLCDVVIFAVKPQILRAVCEQLAPSIHQQSPLFLSIVAGIRTREMEHWLAEPVAIVRSMPNTPAQVSCGATALFANAQVSSAQHEVAEAILRTVGIALWLDEESQMDGVTALSGSGPAYHFLVIEALEQAACKLGLPPETARLLALQTAFGASKMALESSVDCAVLRQRVTSPGGTTEAALKVLEEGGIRSLFDGAIKAACQRSEELAEIAGAD